MSRGIITIIMALAAIIISIVSALAAIASAIWAFSQANQAKKANILHAGEIEQNARHHQEALQQQEEHFNIQRKEAQQQIEAQTKLAEEANRISIEANALTRKAMKTNITDQEQQDKIKHEQEILEKENLQLAIDKLVLGPKGRSASEFQATQAEIDTLVKRYKRLYKEDPEIKKLKPGYTIKPAKIDYHEYMLKKSRKDPIILPKIKR